MKLSRAQEMTLAFFIKTVQVSFIVSLASTILTTCIKDAIIVAASLFTLSIFVLIIPFLVTTLIALLFKLTK